MAFLPGFDYDSNTTSFSSNNNTIERIEGKEEGIVKPVVATVCKITEVYQHENQIVLSLRALCRGLIVDHKSGDGKRHGGPFVGEVLVSVPSQLDGLVRSVGNTSGNRNGNGQLLLKDRNGSQKDQKPKIVSKKVQYDDRDGFEEKKMVQEFVNLQLDTLGASGSNIPSDVNSNSIQR
ncbi:unnamed protein product [Ambrosiozyma monospora]|uniref:Unnamed protein product n=1 Tax=Ambrosiozyma monospora TaxID=43982 RepID=A0ACB5UDD4_AMBMO|nr:unnamed protein product [Ambrosiozyma monospora]